MSDAGRLVLLIGGQEYTATLHLGITFVSVYVVFPLSCEINEAVDHFPDWGLLNMSEINQE